MASAETTKDILPAETVLAIKTALGAHAAVTAESAHSAAHHLVGE